MAVRSIIQGCGSYLPPRVVTNEDLSALVETSHEWIFSRTGISKRHWVDETATTSTLGASAALKALENAGVAPNTIDMIIVATTTPDTTFPSVATMIQRQIGAKKAFCFDVQAVCAGFVYALSVADQFIKTGQVKRALVIGAETMSRVLDTTDRSTLVLFGDGAGALLLEASNTQASQGILSTHLFSDGELSDILYVDGGAGHPTCRSGHLKMLGKDVYRHAVEKMGDAVTQALEANNLTSDDIDWFVPHQANSRIIKKIAQQFNLPEEQIIMTVDQHSNTSAASIPLALAVAEADGRLKKGDRILLTALGGGLAWGAAVMTW